MKRNSLILLLIVFIWSCNNNENRKDKQINVLLDTTKTIEIKVKRYEMLLFSLNKDSLVNQLQPYVKEYSVFLGEKVDESTNLSSMKSYLSDPAIIEASNEIKKQYNTFELQEKQLGEGFTRYQLLMPNVKIPQIFSYISGFYFENPIITNDSIVLIGLELYLGRNFETYKKVSVPQYRTLSMTKDYITADCFKKIAEKHTKTSPVKTLLDAIIVTGKKIYFCDAMMPELADSSKLGFSESQVQWCKKNEERMWAYLIDNQLLYKYDRLLISKFLGEGPFTAAFSKESPARAISWIGWKIIKKFMENNSKVSFKELYEINDSQMILNRSKYKPKSN